MRARGMRMTTVDRMVFVRRCRVGVVDCCAGGLLLITGTRALGGATASASQLPLRKQDQDHAGER